MPTPLLFLPVEVTSVSVVTLSFLEEVRWQLNSTCGFLPVQGMQWVTPLCYQEFLGWANSSQTMSENPPPGHPMYPTIFWGAVASCSPGTPAPLLCLGPLHKNANSRGSQKHPGWAPPLVPIPSCLCPWCLGRAFPLPGTLQNICPGKGIQKMTTPLPQLRAQTALGPTE